MPSGVALDLTSRWAAVSVSFQAPLRVVLSTASACLGVGVAELLVLSPSVELVRGVTRLGLLADLLLPSLSVKQSDFSQPLDRPNILHSMKLV